MAHAAGPPARTGGGTAAMRGHAVWAAVVDLVRDREAELGRPLRVLDLGGGTGGLAVPLAELGHHVTVVDPSADALASLERRARDYAVADRVTAVQGDADSLATLSGPGFDLVCCHGVLEVVDDPALALAQVGEVLAPQGLLSVLVSGRLAMVLARALSGDLAAARAALTSADGRWGRTDPLPRRFDTEQLTRLLSDAGFVTTRVHGVRVLTDIVPWSSVETAADRQALADLEQAVADHPHYAETLGALGSGLHAVASRG